MSVAAWAEAASNVVAEELMGIRPASPGFFGALTWIFPTVPLSLQQRKDIPTRMRPDHIAFS
jgi:hypothetical protein